MNKENPAVTDATIFAAVFNENWQNARHIKSERISFMNAFSLISAGVLTLLQSVQATDLMLRTVTACLHEFVLTVWIYSRACA